MTRLKLFLFLGALLHIGSIGAQTVGNGITLTNFDISNDTLLFDPTTVGTTATKDLLITNLVGVTQDVTITGVGAPYSLSQETLTLGAQEAAVVTLSFDPVEVGEFQDQLLFAGSIFGSGSLNIGGEGTQIDIETSSDFVQFANTAIGSSSAVDLTITNAGSGTMLISSFDFSDNQFSVDEESLSIAEGDSYVLTITFTPVFAGGSSETLTINSNDPNDPALVIDLAATGISEVSGELCGVWGVVNSPYILVDNVVVPDHCSLTIEAGVEVQGNGYDIIANGPLNLLGEEGNRINLVDLDLDMELDNAESIAFNYANVEGVNIQSNAVGVPFEFDWNDPIDGVDGWYNSGGSGGSVSRQGDRVRSEYWSSSNNWRDIYFYSPNRNISLPLDSISFKREIDDYDGNGNGSEYWRFQINADGQGWVTLYEEYHIGDQPEEVFEFDLSDYDIQSSVQFRFHYHFYRGHYFYLDDFNMNLGEEEEFLCFIDLNHLHSSKDFYMTGNHVRLSADSMRTYYANWDQSNSEYQISDWEVEGHTERDEGAYFAGDFNRYDFTRLSLNKDSWSNEQGLEFADIDYSEYRFDSCEFNGFTHGLYVHSSNYSDFWLNECVADSNTTHAIYFTGTTYSDFEISGLLARNNTGRGLQIDGSYNSAVVNHSIFSDNNNSGFGFECGTNWTERDSLSVRNSGFFRNNGHGLRTSCQAELEHLTVLDNSSYGIHTDASFYGMGQVLSSSILWGNGATASWDQLYITNNFINIAHTNVMGGSAGLAGGSWDLDDSFISNMPYFEDEWGHLEAISPGVDGGKPWEIDAHMPMGLGGARADMGMYGGPNNAYWGGDIIQDGSSEIGSVADIPQDQGNLVGLTFTASHWDNNSAIDPVTTYSIWRHLDVGGASIVDINQGNWELIGEVPAQGFEAYGFQAPTLGNTNQFGDFASCFTVIAETELDQLYWQSDVMCGESIDNLAPDAPQVEVGVTDSDFAQIVWFTPAEDDYAYTIISSDHGFEAEVSTDTVIFDASILEGQSYTYHVRHVDANGNFSAMSSVDLAVEALVDVVALNPGWNLISIDREPLDATPEGVFSDLNPGNLQYVTGFNGGAMIFDPNGLSFLNTLTSIEAGRGYWVKVLEADELRVSGNLIPTNYKTPLESGWNLVGFAGDETLIQEYYAEELANNEIIYVTGFNLGSTVFDPNGLPFLNSLTSLQNGFGYWVKAEFENGMVGDPAELSNVHDFLKGRTNPALAGELIQVVNDEGHLVTELKVLEGGWLKTSALYESTVGAAIRPGDLLTFRWNGKISAVSIEFDGNRKVHEVSLDFIGEPFSVFPNPVRSDLHLVFNGWEPNSYSITDASGRVVLSGNWTAGQNQIDVSSLATGVFAISFGDAAGNLEVQTFLVAD